MFTQTSAIPTDYKPPFPVSVATLARFVAWLHIQWDSEKLPLSSLPLPSCTRTGGPGDGSNGATWICHPWHETAVPGSEADETQETGLVATPELQRGSDVVGYSLFSGSCEWGR